MEKKIIIEEIKRIQEVMYGMSIITEAVGNPGKIADFVTIMLKMTKHVDEGKNLTAGITKRMNTFVKGLGVKQGGKIVTDYKKLTQVDDIKKVLKHLTGDTDVIKTIMPAIKDLYKTELLQKGDIGYEIQKFVKTVSDADSTLTKALHTDFLTEFNKVMKEFNEKGIIGAFVWPLVKLSVADFKNTFGMMADTHYADYQMKYLRHMPAETTRAINKHIIDFVKSPWTIFKMVTVGLKPSSVMNALKNLSYRIMFLSAAVMLGEALERFFSDMDNLLADEGAFFAAMPPEAKEIFCLPEADAKEQAQLLWDELQSFNPNEDVILNILSQNGQGSKLIANQIAYEFGMLSDNVGDVSLYRIMNANMSFYLDKVLSTANKLLGLHKDDKWYRSWTATDIMRELNSENFPAVNAPMLKLDEYMQEIAKKGLEDAALWKTFRVGLPQSISNGAQALYSRKGNRMTPGQLFELQEMMDGKGFEGEYESPEAFRTALNKTNQDDYKNMPIKTGFVIVDGEWENGRFKASDENAIPGESYTCQGTGEASKCTKQDNEDGLFKTLGKCKLECEVDMSGNEAKIRQELTTFHTNLTNTLEQQWFDWTN